MEKKNVLTVGDLRKAIEGMPDDSPVRLCAPDTLYEFAKILGGHLDFTDSAKIGFYAEKAEPRQAFSVMGHEWNELSISI